MKPNPDHPEYAPHPADYICEDEDCVCGDPICDCGEYGFMCQCKCQNCNEMIGNCHCPRVN